MKRYDGTEIKLSALKVLEPYVMPLRQTSWGICLQTYDLSKTLPFIKKYNEDNGLEKKNRLTLFQVCLCAAARSVAMHPQLNRFISGKLYFQRNRLNFAFVVKQKLVPLAPETLTKFDFSPYETLDTVRGKMHRNVSEARTEAGGAAEKHIQLMASLPGFLKTFIDRIIKRLDYKGRLSPSYIESDPLFCTSIFANLGSVDVGGRLVHHMFEYGNASSFVTVGRYRKGVVINDDSQIEVKDVVDIGFTIDERITGGAYSANFLIMMKNLVENPEPLLEKPDIPEELIKELNLADLTKYKPYLKLKKGKKK